MITGCFMPRRKKANSTPAIRHTSLDHRVQVGRSYGLSSPPPYRGPVEYTGASVMREAVQSPGTPRGLSTGSHPAQSTTPVRLTSPPKLVPSTHKTSPLLLDGEEGYSQSLIRSAMPRPTGSPLVAPSPPALSRMQHRPGPSPFLSPKTGKSQDQLNVSQITLHDGSAQETIIPPLHTKHSAWSLSTYQMDNDNYIQPPKRSWRSSYEVW
ncbi:hypothetical protein IWQ61_004045 [Dispira simplex]|nr:hypothetical protein IWQ61_004045 [Dispira simplex]